MVVTGSVLGIMLHLKRRVCSTSIWKESVFRGSVQKNGAASNNLGGGTVSLGGSSSSSSSGPAAATLVRSSSCNVSGSSHGGVTRSGGSSMCRTTSVVSDAGGIRSEVLERSTTASSSSTSRPLGANGSTERTQSAWDSIGGKRVLLGVSGSGGSSSSTAPLPVGYFTPTKTIPVRDPAPDESRHTVRFQYGNGRSPKLDAKIFSRSSGYEHHTGRLPPREVPPDPNPLPPEFAAPELIDEAGVALHGESPPPIFKFWAKHSQENLELLLGKTGKKKDGIPTAATTAGINDATNGAVPASPSSPSSSSSSSSSSSASSPAGSPGFSSPESSPSPNQSSSSSTKSVGYRSPTLGERLDFGKETNQNLTGEKKSTAEPIKTSKGSEPIKTSKKKKSREEWQKERSRLKAEKKFGEKQKEVFQKSENQSQKQKESGASKSQDGGFRKQNAASHKVPKMQMSRLHERILQATLAAEEAAEAAERGGDSASEGGSDSAANSGIVQFTEPLNSIPKPRPKPHIIKVPVSTPKKTKIPSKKEKEEAAKKEAAKAESEALKLKESKLEEGFKRCVEASKGKVLRPQQLLDVVLDIEHFENQYGLNAEPGVIRNRSGKAYDLLYRYCTKQGSSQFWSDNGKRPDILLSLYEFFHSSSGFRAFIEAKCDRFRRLVDGTCGQEVRPFDIKMGRDLSERWKSVERTGLEGSPGGKMVIPLWLKEHMESLSNSAVLEGVERSRRETRESEVAQLGFLRTVEILREFGWLKIGESIPTASPGSSPTLNRPRSASPSGRDRRKTTLEYDFFFPATRLDSTLNKGPEIEVEGVKSGMFPAQCDNCLDVISTLEQARSTLEKRWEDRCQDSQQEYGVLHRRELPTLVSRVVLKYSCNGGHPGIGLLSYLHSLRGHSTVVVEVAGKE